MRTQKKILIQQLDKKIKPFKGINNVIIPDNGWIRTIRETLNMTLEQLGNKLNITKQGAKKIEEREINESLSIKSLKEIGEALEMRFVYGFVPKEKSIEHLVNSKANELAKKIVLRTSHTMKLENQGNTDEQINVAITDLANDLKREMNKSLWD